MKPRLSFLVLLLVLSPAGLWAGAVQAVVTSTTGDVRYAPPHGKSFTELKSGMKLETGSTIKTGADGIALVVPVPGAAMRVANNSTVVLQDSDFSRAGGSVTSRRALVNLQSGTLSALIDPKQQSPAKFQIQTPQGIAAARGTFYAVTVDAASGQTFVAVKHGEVGVSKAKTTKDKDKT